MSRSLARLLTTVIATVTIGTLVVLADAESESGPAESAPVRDSIQWVINEQFQAVKPIFEYSCYDCHSDATDYPWYHSIPGIGGLLDSHVEEGREHLDMSNGFPFKGYEDQAEALEEIREEIEEGEMPLWSYRLIHWGRQIEGSRRDSVFAWIDASRLLLRVHQGPGESSH